MTFKSETAVPNNGDRAMGISVGSNLTPGERVQNVLDIWGTGDYAGFDLDLVRNELRLVSATAKPSATATFGFTVTAPFCNRLGALHGGAAALIFDICTSCALAPIAYPGFWAAAGVSRTLNVTYLRPAPRGTKCLIECEVVHAGKRLCTVRGVMKREEDGAVLCTAEHGKASIDPLQNSKL